MITNDDLKLLANAASKASLELGNTALYLSKLSNDPITDETRSKVINLIMNNHEYESFSTLFIDLMQE